MERGRRWWQGFVIWDLSSLAHVWETAKQRHSYYICLMCEMSLFESGQKQISLFHKHSQMFFLDSLSLEKKCLFHSESLQRDTMHISCFMSVVLNLSSPDCPHALDLAIAWPHLAHGAMPSGWCGSPCIQKCVCVGGDSGNINCHFWHFYLSLITKCADPWAALEAKSTPRVCKLSTTTLSFSSTYNPWVIFWIKSTSVFCFL